MPHYFLQEPEGAYRPDVGIHLTDEQYARCREQTAAYYRNAQAIDGAILRELGRAIASACWWSWVTGKSQWEPDTWWAE